MQSNGGDSGMAAAAMAVALANRMPQANDNPSQNMMRAYMDTLKELVPQCPKNRSVSKLELIQHVIDYINDLQETLQNGGADSPPPSPTPDPISFSEAFSQLGFGEAKTLLQLTQAESHIAAASGFRNSHVYTSDGSSDYDSRGSSPVNSHSDTDYSSDEHPLYIIGHRGALLQGVGAVPKVFSGAQPPSIPGPSTFFPTNVYKNEPKRLLSRRGCEFQPHYTG